MYGLHCFATSFVTSFMFRCRKTHESARAADIESQHFLGRSSGCPAVQQERVSHLSGGRKVLLSLATRSEHWRR